VLGILYAGKSRLVKMGNTEMLVVIGGRTCLPEIAVDRLICGAPI
jgi:hypothetical protein